MNLLKQIKKIAAVAASSAIVIGSLMPSWQINALDNTVNTKKAENIAADVTTDTSGFDLSTAKKGDGSSYITNAVIEYQSGTDWINVNGAENIPADARLRITVDYDKVPSSAVKANKNTVTYSLSGLLIEPRVTSGTIQNENYQQIGTISADAKNRLISMVFNDGHLSGDTISGSFTFTAGADKSLVKKNPEQTVSIGPLDTTIHFEENAGARLGTLNIVKGKPVYIPADSTSGYLEYTVTVSAGDEEMPDVVVADKLSDGSWAFADSTEPYVNVTSTEKILAAKASGADDAGPYETIASSDSSAAHGRISYTTESLPDNTASSHAWLKWDIGTMAANESRTLTYRVKVNDNFVGLSADNAVSNTAVPYSRIYPHGSATSNYTPTASVSSKKQAGDVIDNGNNTITIPYTVTVTADSSNTWTLRNVKLNDMVSDGTATISNTVLQKYHAAFSNFKVNGQTGNYTLNSYETGRDRSPSFDYYFGDLAPGETRTITYNLTLDKAILTYMSGQISFINYARIFSNDAVTTYGNKQLSSSNVNKVLGSKQWNRKLHGDSLTKDVTQTVSGGNIYEPQNDSWQAAADQSEQTVTIPAGSYQYQVVVNEAGDWDVSSAIMRDALGNSYLTYKGYLRLDYYQKGISATASSDQEAVNQLQRSAPTKTMWLKIDGLTSLSIIPSQLDSSLGRGAYLLTYYASPSNVGNISKVTTSNTFKLSGNVIGPGSTAPVTMEGISVNTSVVVDGDVNYSAQKYGWYFDNVAEGSDYDHGKLYWVIDVTGSSIPAGTKFIDKPADSFIRGTSLVGIYIGTIPDQTLFTDYYASINDVTNDVNTSSQSDKNLTQIADSSYTVPVKTNDTLAVQMKNEVTLTGAQHLYIVIKTDPKSAWSSERDTKLFKNKLTTQETGASEFDRGEATLMANGGGTNFKENVAVMARDESGWHNLDANGSNSNDSWPLTGNGYSKVIKNDSMKNGIYLDWHIKINYAANESGTVTVEDALPAGVEPVYVRYFWARGEGLKITMPEITDDRINDQDWVDIGLKNTLSDGKTATLKNAYAYYNAPQNRILFDVAGLQKAPVGTSPNNAKDSFSLEVQIVVYVTDAELLHSAVTSKQFTNGMTVTKNGQILTKDTATMTVPAPKIGKTMNHLSGTNQVEFTLTVNPYGNDLVAGSDSITLIDDMDKSLDFDPESVVVKDSAGNTIKDVTASISDITDGSKITGHRLQLILPDEKKLTITYKGLINAKPGTQISVTNKAYWQGHEIKTPQINNQKIDYSVDATSRSDTLPQIQIVKYDANNLSKKLGGAVFRIQQAVYDSSTQQWVADTSKGSYDQTTSSEKASLGNAVFNSSTTSSAFMAFDTVYMITEVKAPSGYQRDTSVYLVEVAAYHPDSKTYSDRSGDSDKGVTVYYGGTIYTQNLYNKKGSLEITKVFQDMTGKTITGTDIPDGTYSFGLYDHASPATTDKPLQVLSLVSQGGTYSYYLTYEGWGLTNVKEDNPLFVDLAAGSEFYVYELDQNGQPVREYDAGIPTTAFTAQNGLSYEASYSSDGAVIPDTGNAEVTITNRRHFEYEPVTGVRLTDDKLLSWALVLVIGILLTGLLKRMGKDM